MFYFDNDFMQSVDRSHNENICSSLICAFQALPLETLVLGSFHFSDHTETDMILFKCVIK
jgi:hypothetical protein